MDAADKIAKMRDRMTPEELERELDDNSEKGVAQFSELLDIRSEMRNKLKQDSFVAKQIAGAKELYSCLVQDGLLKIEDSSEGSLLDLYTTNQAMEAIEPQMVKVESAVPQERAIGMAEVYRMNYEHICKSFLRSLASKIAKREIQDNGEALQILNGYRSGAFKELFKSLVPQIRNSVDHHDYYLDPKTGKITFRDRKKPPMIMTLEEFWPTFIISFTLTLAISAAEFEIKVSFLRDVASKKELVAQFIKKHNLKLERDPKGPSIYEMGKTLERNRNKW